MSKNILDPKVPANHIKMMQSPDLWPLGPVLALKRPHAADAPPFKDADVLCGDKHSEMGVMFAVGSDRWRVYRLNLYDRRLKMALLSGTAELDDSVTVYDYADAEEVFDAGWRVD